METTTNSFVLYRPMADEVDYTGYFPNFLLADNIMLPCDKKADPFEWANLCTKRYKDRSPIILLPGKFFDLAGSRRGHGEGWYDRFLSAVPAAWPRIGFAKSSQISTPPIVRRKWDQPVDLLVVKDVFSWRVHRTLARNL